jgi:hypothetical protein
MSIPNEEGDAPVKSADGLPDISLGEGGRITALFRDRGLPDFGAAARYLRRLPFGRVSERGNLALVVTEGRGTCATKHALLARLAAEQGIDATLTLGIYEMHERNTPGVGTVLDTYGLPYIPEAHCYLAYDGQRVDITREAASAEPIVALLHEETISPEQIDDYKRGVHRQFLDRWRARSPEAAGYGLDDLWRIREECIAALSTGG